MTFLPDRIEIVGEKIKMEIPIKSVFKVHCVDARTSDGQINEKMTIYFHQKRVRRKRERIIRVRLRYYLQADEFMAYLLKYENINFDCSDFDVHLDVECEE